MDIFRFDDNNAYRVRPELPKTAARSAAVRPMRLGKDGIQISPFPQSTPVGMAYVPMQLWEEPFDDETAFERGTLFPSLYLPYEVGGAGCER